MKIKYKSPSGKVNIGKNVPPFQKAKGFGYQGVVLEDVKTGQLQCHICGKWFGQLDSHLRGTHKVSTKKYKEKFSLLQSTALVSKKERLRRSKTMRETREEHPHCTLGFKHNNKFASNRKECVVPMEAQNKKGVCNLQIFEKINMLYKKLGKTPSLTDLKDEYGAGIIKILSLRYGSYLKVCKEMNFKPVYSNQNPKYSKVYFIKRAKEISKKKKLQIRDFTVSEQRAFYRYFPSLNSITK